MTTEITKEASVNSAKTSGRIKKLRQLAVLMNTRHQNPFPLTGELLGCFDIALTEEEVDFLLAMGTEPYTYKQGALRNNSPFLNFSNA